MLRKRVARPAGPRGLSLIELMVGSAIGLFLVAGAVTVFVANMGNSRQMLVEARVNQDLRAVADLISRDLRRAGYWDNAISGAIAVGATGTPVQNPYSAVTPTGTSRVEYLFSRDSDNTPDDEEYFGFRRAVDGDTGRGVIQMKISGGAGGDNWQTLTDPSVIDIPPDGATLPGLIISETATVVQVGGACAKVCPPPVGAAWTCPNPPTITLRQYDITVRGQAVADARVVRTLRTRARVRNDRAAGVCPV